MQNFDWGNFDIFDAFQLDRQNLTCQIEHLQVCGERQGPSVKIFSVNIFRQIFEESVSLKISPHQSFALYDIAIAS